MKSCWPGSEPFTATRCSSTCTGASARQARFTAAGGCPRRQAQASRAKTEFLSSDGPRNCTPMNSSSVLAAAPQQRRQPPASGRPGGADPEERPAPAHPHQRHPRPGPHRGRPAGVFHRAGGDRLGDRGIRGLGEPWPRCASTSAAAGVPGRHRVLADFTRTKQVLISFLSTPSSTTATAAGSRWAGRRWTMGPAGRVRDTGIGIPADRIGELFQP